MKSYEVTYTKGHLIDVQTGQRIFLKRGGKFNILGDDDQFAEKDELKIIREALSASEKQATLETAHPEYHLEKIAEAQQILVYRIGLSQKTSEDRRYEFLFDAVLLEDLYIRSKNGEDWSLCDCLCESRNCLEGELQMIEAVQGSSLSNLFSNMVAFYFPLQRSGACNAFTTFYYSDPLPGTEMQLFSDSPHRRLNEVKNGALPLLQSQRQEIQERYQSLGKAE